MCNLGHRVVKLIEMLMIHLNQDADDVVNTFAVLKEGCCALCDAAGLKLRIHSH